MLKRVLLSLCFLMSAAHAQETPVVTNPTFYDDTYVQVPLQFGFPFYGRTFTNSWMHSNGVVSFLDPAVPIEGVGYNPGAWAYCCGGRPTGTTPQFSYMIAPLWTDLYPTADSSFRTEGTSTYQKYFWSNLGEISNTANKNTFSLEIRPTGFIGVDYSQINMFQTAWIGTVGNASSGQVNEIYYGNPGLNFRGITGWSQQNTPADLCYTDPLSSQSCPGYAAAYLTQQCSANPLYSSQCPGYAAAYYSQQCSINTLYDPGCPGYATAYLEYQCSLDPLYSTTCQGYETAYFNQQCSLDPLYNNACPGYEVAYFDQQCSLNTLYSNQCPGYAEAYALANIVVTTPTPVTTTITEPAAVAVVSDPVVNDVITTTTTSTTSTTATVQLAPAPAPAATTTVATTTVEKKEEASNKDTSSTTTASTETTSEKKTEKPTARQELVAKRREAAKQAAIKAGQTAAEDMSSATSMEAQIAVQNVVIAAMGFTPGFQAYNVIMPDGVGYKPFTVYKNQKNVDNRKLSRGLTGPSDVVHEQMVAAQWELK